VKFKKGLFQALLFGASAQAVILSTGTSTAAERTPPGIDHSREQIQSGLQKILDCEFDRETPFLIQQLFLMRFPEAQLPDCFGNPSPAVVVARTFQPKEEQ